MNKENFVKELESKLTKLSEEAINEEISSINDFIEKGTQKKISEEELVKSLGSIEDLVNTIYLKHGIKDAQKNNFKDTLLIILTEVKRIFQSKDKKVILKTLGKLLVIILIAIIIKVPFIFIKTLLLDFLNSINLSYGIQNIISIIFEFIYIVVALLYIYKKLKNIFVSQNKSV